MKQVCVTLTKIRSSILDDLREIDRLILDAGEDLATIIARYEEMLAAFKAKVNANKTRIADAGYNEIVQAAIAVHEYRIAELKKKQSGTVSVKDVSYLISQYTSQLDSYAYLGKQLCTDGYVDELSTLLPKYKAILAALVTLNSTSRSSIEAAGYGSIVTGAIELHTLELKTLGSCIPSAINIPETGIIPGVRVDATVDGDTLTVVIPNEYLESGAESKINIRLAGCNAPEKPDGTTQAGNSVVEYTTDNYSSFMYVEKKYYSEATMKLGLLVGGKMVTLKVNPSRPYDSYNRLVAVIETADGSVANEEMLKAGLCAYFHRSEWTDYRDPVNHDKYIQLESSAKAGKLGFWASATGSVETGQCIITATRPTATGGAVSSSALVYVDGTYMGMTSTTVPYTLPVGTHTVRAVSSQYGSGTKEVEITANCMITANIAVGSSSSGGENESEETGFVTFQALRKSSTGDYLGTTAEVWEGGKYKFIVQSTKDNVQTSTGDHTYVFKKDGYETEEVTVTVEKNESTIAKAILTESDQESETDPSTVGAVDFISTPTGAKIYLGENYIGLTKKLNHQLAPGIYYVWIKKAGYTDYTEQLIVEAGKKAIVDAQMVTGTGSEETPGTTTETGLLDFISNPSGAYIYVDNIYIGMTKKVGYKVSAGTHLISIRKNGYNEHEDTEEVVAVERLPIEITLTKSDTGETAEEEEEEERSYNIPAGGINWVTYPEQNYPMSSYSGTGYTPTTEQPALTSTSSTTIPEETPADTLPVQIIVMQETPDTEKLGDQFKELRKFYKKYCDTELSFSATKHAPIDPDKDDDEMDIFDDIDLIEDQIDLDKVQDEQGIVMLLWVPTGKSAAYDGTVLSRDELLNGSVVCSIPLESSENPFSEEIEGKTKDTLGLTTQGSLTMAICLSNALLEWYNSDHEAEEGDELSELDKVYCGYDEDEKARPHAKCIKKWLQEYNEKVGE